MAIVFHVSEVWNKMKAGVNFIDSKSGSYHSNF